jgi:hypothetical protein
MWRVYGIYPQEPLRFLLSNLTLVSMAAEKGFRAPLAYTRGSVGAVSSISIPLHCPEKGEFESKKRGVADEQIG